MKPKQYKDKDGDLIECGCCGSLVPTIRHKNYDDEYKYSCLFCFESVGHQHSEISKQLLANMFNILLRELKK